jgi:hypothetical protein
MTSPVSPNVRFDLQKKKSKRKLSPFIVLLLRGTPKKPPRPSRHSSNKSPNNSRRPAVPPRRVDVHERRN